MLSKMKTSVVVAALLLAVSAYAKDTNVTAPSKINIAAIQASLSELPAVEIPVKASELMKAASKEAKLETAKAILKSVLEQRPQMAIQLVASLVKASPESASQISTLALAIVPQYGDAIVRVAAISAPQYAAEIAVAAVAAYPASQSDVVNWVSLAVPSQASSVSAAIEQRATENQYVRFITDALAQGGGGGTILSVKETLSKIIAGNPTLQNGLQQGLQKQLEKANRDVKNLAASQLAAGGSSTVEIVEKRVEVKVIGGFVQIVETIISKKTVTITKNPDGTAQESAPVEIPLTPEEQTPVTVAEVNPTEFPEPNQVPVQQGEAGAAVADRIEQAAKDAAEAYNL